MTGQSGVVPRLRQEVEAPSLLQSRQEVPLVRAQTTYTTLVTARADAYFLTEGLFAANVTAGALTVSVSLVAPAGSATSANAVVQALSVAANTTVQLVGATGLLIPPGYTLQGACSSNNGVNLFGWGWNISGDTQR